MTNDNLKNIVILFNENINRHNIGGLAELMTEDHTFIDSENNSILGKEKALEAWISFFKLFPDYRNVFENLNCSENVVTITGRSVCSDKELEGPALWTAVIKEGKVGEWRVYYDTKNNRLMLGIPESG